MVKPIRQLLLKCFCLLTCGSLISASAAQDETFGFILRGREAQPDEICSSSQVLYTLPGRTARIGTAFECLSLRGRVVDSRDFGGIAPPQESAVDERVALLDQWRQQGHSATVTLRTGNALQLQNVTFYYGAPPGLSFTATSPRPRQREAVPLRRGDVTIEIGFQDIRSIAISGDVLNTTVVGGTVVSGRIVEDGTVLDGSIPDERRPGPGGLVNLVPTLRGVQQRLPGVPLLWAIPVDSVTTVTFLDRRSAAPSRDDWEEIYVDSNRNLMWTRKDNGHQVTGTQADAYCTALRLGGFSDWRVPAIRELATLHALPREDGFLIRRPFSITNCCQWSSTQVNDSSKIRWHYDFNRGVAKSYFNPGDGRVLCARRVQE